MSVSCATSAASKIVRFSVDAPDVCIDSGKPAASKIISSNVTSLSPKGASRIFFAPRIKFPSRKSP